MDDTTRDGTAQPFPVEPDRPWGGSPEQAPPAPDPAPRRPTGPAWATVAFGLVSLALGATVLTVQLTDTSVDWKLAMPLGIAGIGVILVLVGLVGLVTRSRRG